MGFYVTRFKFHNAFFHMEQKDIDRMFCGIRKNDCCEFEIGISKKQTWIYNWSWWECLSKIMI